MKHKIVFFNLEPWAKEHLEENSELKRREIEVVFESSTLDKDHVPGEKNFDIAGIFVDSVVGREVLENLPNLKSIVTLSTGYDHIDIDACKRRNVAVSFVPSYGENTVAEFTFGLLISLARKICDGHNRVRETGSFNLDGLRGFDLAGKTLGVIGTGRIGRHVIRIAKGFEMDVVAFDVRPDAGLADELGFTYLSFEEALGKSDIVTLHVPYMKETHHLLNHDTINLMKRGAYLVNTSRGGVVETEALVKALKEGQLAGAALDVLEEEGAVKDELNLLVGGKIEEHNLKVILANHVLIDMPNVLITPHNAFNSREALERILETSIENIIAYVEGKSVNVVT